MTPHYADEQVTVYHGDCLDVLPTLADASVDAIVTDPPYELAFMGKGWDATGIAYNADVWKHCLRVLRPGGHLAAFGGTRTWHRLAAAIEDAGFEIRDSIAWLYGSGFPKSLDVSKAIDKAAGAEREVIGENPLAAKQTGQAGTAALRGDRNPNLFITAPATDAARQWQGWGTSLKPAHEPIILARKPLQGTVAANVLTHGTGALNIDACRIAHGDDVDLSQVQRQQQGEDNGWRRAKNMVGTEVSMYKPAGRWPANVILDPHTAAQLDQQSGISSSTQRIGARTGKPSGIYGDYVGQDDVTMGHNDSGGASRFFYCAKAPTTQRPSADGVAHPTVKPLDLIQWLIRLITPPGGLILDPFAGSGTTAEAAIAEGKRCIAIEREHSYLPLITARTNNAQIGFDL